MSKNITVKEAKKKADRIARVKRTAQQIFLTALISVYPLVLRLAELGDWAAVKAAVPVVVTTVVGAIVTDLYNRVRPAS